ncbi:hypothetical protein [Leptospira ilyithenensis]|uniref:Uncharacterized protein n=1 Tax=Leptospira ilyithenensis TaxID=2484901 RepID=A0A4R9LR99_9LEPT|nr:hypothetical protein [Leptospira ilyithenensis]TGN13211.1 hypothetical protein EHS11_04775 [Leptospira ilyithenensis]
MKKISDWEGFACGSGKDVLEGTHLVALWFHISFQNGNDIEGLGCINDSKYVKGFFYHPTLAVTVDGTALGILDSQVRARESTLDGRTNNQKKVDRKRTPKGRDPIHWIILTTIPILNFEDAS